MISFNMPCAHVCVYRCVFKGVCLCAHACTCEIIIGIIYVDIFTSNYNSVNINR